MFLKNNKKFLNILALITIICFLLCLSATAWSLSAPVPDSKEKAQKTIKPFGFVSKKIPDKLEKTKSDIGTGISIYINDAESGKDIEPLNNKIDNKGEEKTKTSLEEQKPLTKEPKEKEAKAQEPQKTAVPQENKTPDNSSKNQEQKLNSPVKQEQATDGPARVKDKENFRKRSEEMKAAFDKLNEKQKKEIYALDDEIIAIKEKMLLKYAEFGIITKEEALEYNAKMKEFREKSRGGAKIPGLKGGKSLWKKSE